MKFGRFFLIIYLAVSPLAVPTLDAQEATILEFEERYELAMRYIKLSLFADGITELDQAVQIARTNGFEKEYLQASIDMAETMRKTRDFERGVEILLNLGAHPEYPSQEVRRLGRIAAIYHELIAEPPKAQFDSVTKYLNPAIRMAETHELKLELASLKNELGYLLSKHRDWKEGLPYHEEAALIYYENGDVQNYVGAMTKVVNLLTHHTRETEKTDSIIQKLLIEVEGKEWYSAENELYANIASFYLHQKNDSANYYQWQFKSIHSTLLNSDVIHSDQMNNLRVVYETEELRNAANASAQALERQEARNRELAVYLTILGCTILITAWLFYRERKTKKAMDKVNQQLQVANEKYQMLMVESNHRIKNNLQMIISMLEYAGKDVDPENTRALKRMSGKIHTISALHKHLYADVHNEKVDLATYFREIIALYTALAQDDLKVNEHFDSVSIPSERLIYFGLIFNEMLSNTIEHNTAPVKQVYISANKHGDAFTFAYRDDSVHEKKETQGTGSLLIRQLIGRINGENLEFDPTIGQYKFSFYA